MKEGRVLIDIGNFFPKVFGKAADAPIFEYFGNCDE